MPTKCEGVLDEQGCKTVKRRYVDPQGKESEYEMRLFEGFVGSSSVLPDGVETLELYRQQGVYTDPHGRIAPVSMVKLKGGPNGRNVHLRVRNEPQDPVTYKGPILSFTVTLRTPAGGPAPVINKPELVEVVVGADEVESIFVVVREAESLQELGSTEAAGTAGAGGGGGDKETWVVEDDAATCPPDC